MSIPYVIADTEDDSHELLSKGKSGHLKKMVQICAISSTHGVFHNDGDRDHFLGWLMGHGECVVYFHNLRYDIGSLFSGELDALDVSGVGGRMIRARWKSITFLDSLNLWPMSVKKLGRAFGLEKLAFDPNSSEYAMRDVEIVAKAVNYVREMAADNGVDRLPATIGGLAMKIFKNQGGKSWYNDWISTETDAPMGYYGGRVELFGIGGKGNIAYTDINSLYPSCLTMGYPEHMEKQKDIDCHGLASATVFVPLTERIAPLPVRRLTGEIEFPVGQFSGVWPCAELCYAVENGATIQKLNWIFGSTNSVPYYKSFIDKFYDKRLKSQSEPESLFYKLLMNNLYGQLAMSGEIKRSISLQDRDFDGEDFIGGGIPYGKKKYIGIQMPLPEHCNYVHAAHVTAYARIELQKHLRKVPADDLIYCDTDSVIFFNRGNELPFPVGNELGRMKLVGFANECRTFAPKCYSYGNDFKAKGVKVSMAREFLLNGEATFAVPFGFSEACEFYDRGNAKPLSVWRKVTKRFKSTYDKKKLIDGLWFPIKLEATVAQ